MEVHSLKAKPEYNGKSGTLVAFDTKSERWLVDLASGGSLIFDGKSGRWQMYLPSLKVKAGNLTKLESRVSPPRASGGGAEGEGAWAKCRGRQRARGRALGLCAPAS